MARIVVADELLHPLPFYDADGLWPVEKLKEHFCKDSTKGYNGRDKFLFLNCTDKNYWIQQVARQSCVFEASHPLINRGTFLEQVEKLTEEIEEIGVFYEYFDPESTFADKISELGCLFYCEAHCHVKDELALEQALIEMIDWFTLNMCPIDEVFCRTRNHTGRDERPDCCTVFLKFADGVEAHWFISALGEEGSRGISCIGSKGTYSWDGGIGEKGIRRTVGRGELNNTYRIVDWIHKSARLERSISYGESKR